MWKKRIAAALFAVLLLLSSGVSALAAEDEVIVEIGSVEDLTRLQVDPAGHYRLTEDLDLSGINWMPVDFSGTLDGGGHTIYNLRVEDTGSILRKTVDGNNKAYATAFAGLFAALVDATVTDLNLVGVDIRVETTQHIFAGALAGYIENSTVTGVTVTDARVDLTVTSEENPKGPSNRCMAGVGGLLGFGCGTVTDCTVDAVLIFDDQSASALKCEQFMGGILACGNAVITNCRVAIDGYDACRGYVHNGGLVGMFYRYDRSVRTGSISGCTVTGAIHFFEDNPDRRAYCAAYVGEPLTAVYATGCTEDFTRDETEDYTAVMKPETCENPQIVDTPTVLDCQWGYTTHACTVCGNTWRDSFTPPPHVPGEWVIVQAATFEESGLKRRSCTLCDTLVDEVVIAPHVAGEWVTVQEPDYGRMGVQQRLCTDCDIVLQEELLPIRVAVQLCTPDPAQLELECGKQAHLSARITPDDAFDSRVVWSSEDESIATVDDSGTVHALRPGTVNILCASADGFASGTCTVQVRYSPWQWVVHYVLFGWLWES